MGQCRSIAGSRILITGASQGIGRALAELAARSGAKVLAAARSAPLIAPARLVHTPRRHSRAADETTAPSRKLKTSTAAGEESR